MAFGVDDTGFILKRFSDIKDSLDQSLAANVGPINTAEDSVLGQLISIFGKELSDLWEALEAIYKSRDPDAASGISLDDIADILSINRIAASYSTVTLQFKGSQGTVIPTGFTTAVLGTTDYFTVDSSGSIDQASAVEITISVKNVINSTTYSFLINSTTMDFTSDASATDLEIIAGLVAKVTTEAEPVTAIDNLDGTLTLSADDYNVSFSSSVDANLDLDFISSNIDCTAQETGGIIALATTLTDIQTPVSGLDSVSNKYDATLGNDEETDSELRLRRQQSLNITGAATVEAIKARLLQIDDVTGAVVIENETDVTDGDGRPPHSFECIVGGATDQEVADEIWLVKAAGIQTTGNTSVVVTDTQGYNHDIEFSRATNVYAWLRITLTYNTEETFPVDGIDQVKTAALATGVVHNISDDVVVQKFYAACYSAPGVATALIEIATSATPGGPAGAYQTTNLTVGATDVAVFDSTRITATIT